MSCEHCMDENGEQLMPYYGLAPHTHGKREGIRSLSFATLTFLSEDEWPANFKVSSESQYHGTYWCDRCGEGKPDDL